MTANAYASEIETARVNGQPMDPIEARIKADASLTETMRKMLLGRIGQYALDQTREEESAELSAAYERIGLE